MRFFKYLLLISASIISVDALAAAKYQVIAPPQIFPVESSPDAACSAYASQMSVNSWKYSVKSTTETMCYVTRSYNGSNPDNYSAQIKKTLDCPAKGWPIPVYVSKGSKIPTRMCKDGCSIEGQGMRVGVNDTYDMTPMQFTGDDVNCTEQHSNDPPPCDTKDPYGKCYIPPNDGCTRLSDGSITCPPDQPAPPKNNDTCNGATYCKRPPEGCGEGYVSGSFNGEALCVRSGPNTPKDPSKPDDPQDPKNCMNGGTYCPQPPNNTNCPDGYYQTTYNGSKICVKNNPDPEKPNPNDPTGGKGPDGSGGPDGGDGGGDGSTGGGTIDVKGIIDAINALKAALLNALSGISAKIDKLINGQTETNKKLDTSNDHLKNIKDESTKTNEKLDTSNGHLEKIEEATQSTSEAIGESNKKLDSMKEAIEGQYKCANENYDPNDKRSSKYRPCTEKDITGGSPEDTKVDVQEKSIDLEKDLRRDLFGGNSSCPPPLVIEFTWIDKVHLELPYDLMCDGAALVRPWIILLGLIVSYFVITGQRSGGQD